MTFNPYALERESLELGPHGTYRIADITKQRDQALNDLRTDLEALQEQASGDDAAQGDTDAMVALLVQMLVVMLEDTPADLADKLIADWDSGALGIGSIKAAVEYVNKKLQAEGNA